MAFDGVPYAVENGARATAAVARAAHYAATRGNQGVTEPDDLKVTATATPSGQVQIAAGSATLRNHGAPRESYHGLARTLTNISVSPTAATIRSDLIIARIVDPAFSPWTTADIPDAVNGPYFMPHRVAGVSASTTKASDVVSYSAIALARIDIPANITNITNAHIVDLRQLAQPRQEIQQYTTIPTAAQQLTATGYATWPTFANRNVVVPSWATKVVIEVNYGGVKVLAGGVFGFLRARLGTITTLPSGYDVNTTSSANAYDRQGYLVADTLAVPAAMRGTTQAFSLEGHRNAGSTTVIEVDAGGTVISATLTFLEGVA